jgi:pilus assembly protein CpaB
VTRRTGWLLLSLGLVLAIGSGALVYIILQQQAAAAEQRAIQTVINTQQVQTIPLPVAARPLTPGRPITAEDIVVKDFPVDLVPTTAVTNSVDLESRILLRPIEEGDVIRRSEILGESGTALSQQIRQGQVLFAFPIVDLMAQSDVIQDGDRIDLFLSTPIIAPDGSATGRVSALTLQNIEVFKVLRPLDEEGNPGAATALLCSMSPQDAVMLKFIKDSGGMIDFALRSPLDADPFVAPPVSDSDLNARYLTSQ